MSSDYTTPEKSHNHRCLSEIAEAIAKECGYEVDRVMIVLMAAMSVYMRMPFNLAVTHSSLDRVCPVLSQALEVFQLQSEPEKMETLRMEYEALQHLRGLEAADQARYRFLLEYTKSIKPVIIEAITNDSLPYALRFPGACFISQPAVETPELLSGLSADEKRYVADLMNLTWEGYQRAKAGPEIQMGLHMLLSVSQTGMDALLNEVGLFGVNRTPPLLLLPGPLIDHGPGTLRRDHGFAQYVNQRASKFYGVKFKIERDADGFRGQTIAHLMNTIKKYPEVSSRFGWLREMVNRIMVMLAIDHSTATITKKIAEEGARLVDYAFTQHLKVIVGLKTENLVRADILLTDQETVVFRKILNKGPIDRRSLQRSFHSYKADELKGQLESLMRKGAINLTDTGYVTVQREITSRGHC